MYSVYDVMLMPSDMVKGKINTRTPTNIWKTKLALIKMYRNEYQLITKDFIMMKDTKFLDKMFNIKKDEGRIYMNSMGIYTSMHIHCLNYIMHIWEQENNIKLWDSIIHYIPIDFWLSMISNHLMTQALFDIVCEFHDIPLLHEAGIRNGLSKVIYDDTLVRKSMARTPITQLKKMMNISSRHYRILHETKFLDKLAVKHNLTNYDNSIDSLIDRYNNPSFKKILKYIPLVNTNEDYILSQLIYSYIWNPKPEIKIDMIINIAHLAIVDSYVSQLQNLYVDLNENSIGYQMINSLITWKINRDIILSGFIQLFKRKSLIPRKDLSRINHLPKIEFRLLSSTKLNKLAIILVNPIYIVDIHEYNNLYDQLTI